MRSLLGLMLLVSALGAKASCPESTTPLADLTAKGFVYSARLSMGDVERRQTVTVQVNGSGLALPFGYSNSRWKEFRSHIKSGDQIVPFNAKPLDEGPLNGATGYLLVRNGCIVESILTSIR
jgi:hypothetical protein